MALAVATVLLTNVLIFAMTLLFIGWDEGDTFRFKYGTFYQNGEAVGLAWDETFTYVFLLFAFLIFYFKKYRKGQLPLDS